MLIRLLGAFVFLGLTAAPLVIGSYFGWFSLRGGTFAFVIVAVIWLAAALLVVGRWRSGAWTWWIPRRGGKLDPSRWRKLTWGLVLPFTALMVLWVPSAFRVFSDLEVTQAEIVECELWYGASAEECREDLEAWNVIALVVFLTFLFLLWLLGILLISRLTRSRKREGVASPPDPSTAQPN